MIVSNIAIKGWVDIIVNLEQIQILRWLKKEVVKIFVACNCGNLMRTTPHVLLYIDKGRWVSLLFLEARLFNEHFQDFQGFWFSDGLHMSIDLRVTSSWWSDDWIRESESCWADWYASLGWLVAVRGCGWIVVLSLSETGFVIMVTCHL